MAQMTKAGRPQKDIRILVGADSYEKQVSDVNFAPTTVTWQGGTPDAVLEDATWILNITMVQALDDADSFSRWAFDHRGETVTVQWKPHADADFTLESEITVPAFTLGGPVGAYNTTTLACRSTEPTEVVTP
jgi:hypothetical protein